MQWAALIAWIITALGGLALAFHWARHGGLTQQEGIRTPRLAAHLVTAVVGLGLWIAYLASNDTLLAWLAVGVLVVVALIGISMLLLSLRGQTNTIRTEAPAEGVLPLPLVVLHGALAMTTVTLALLAALEIGS
jgi:hypothetical protein